MVVLEALEDDGAGGLLVGVALAAVAVEGLQREHVRVVHARAEVGRPDRVRRVGRKVVADVPVDRLRRRGGAVGHDAEVGLGVVALVRAGERHALREVREGAVAAPQAAEAPEDPREGLAVEPRLAGQRRLVRRREVARGARVAHAVERAHEARRAGHALRHVAQLPLLGPGPLRAARAGDALACRDAAVEARRAQLRHGLVVVLAVRARRARVAQHGLDRGRVEAREAVARLERALLLGELALGRRHGHGRARRAHEARGAQAAADGARARALAVEARRARLRVARRRGPHLVVARARAAVGARLARVGPQRRVVAEGVARHGAVAAEEAGGAQHVRRRQRARRAGEARRADGRVDAPEAGADVADGARRAGELRHHGVVGARRARERVCVRERGGEGKGRGRAGNEGCQRQEAAAGRRAAGPPLRARLRARRRTPRPWEGAEGAGGAGQAHAVGRVEARGDKPEARGAVAALGAVHGLRAGLRQREV